MMVAFPLGLGALVFGGLMYIMPGLKGASKNAFVVSWVIKVIAGLALLYTYTQVYPKRAEADAFKYFDDGIILREIADEDPAVFTRILLGTWSDSDLHYLNRLNYWFRSYDHGIANDNRVVIRVNALLNLVTRGSYGLNLLVFLVLAWLGSYWLFQLFLGLSSTKITSYIAAFLVPSTVFWSSGILKEALLFFALGGFLYSMFRLHQRFRWGVFTLGIVCFLLLLFLKIYILMALLPIVLLTWLWVQTTSWKQFAGSFLACIAAFITCHVLFFPDWSPLSTLQGKQFDFIQMAHAVNAGSIVPIIPMDGRMSTVLALIPLGIWNVLVYPDFSMLKNGQSLVAFTENVLILLILLGAVLRLRGISWTLDWRFPSLLFSLAVLSLVGMTAPVVGAMVRYKAPVLPFLLMSLLHYQLPYVKQVFTSNRFYQWLNTHL
ncbi:MAG: hypothetical protein K9I25_03405 [Crocinitomicaceae bacterium]|nr:hypothetical protein [Cryomorphaceae bacterium]MCF8268991.1 hypothetical protein [Crocinitomicaceae bacterium]